MSFTTKDGRRVTFTPRARRAMDWNWGDLIVGIITAILGWLAGRKWPTRPQ